MARIPYTVLTPLVASALLFSAACAQKNDAAPRQGDSASAAATGTGGARRGTVLFVGTSLTAGLGLDPDSAYPQLIEEKIRAATLPFDVVNAGVSGETTSGLLRRLDWLMRGAFDVVVIETGANDGLRGIPVATVRENVDSILARIRRTHPQARVLLVQMEALPNFGPQYTGSFRALYAELAEKHGAELMPFLLDGVAGRAELNQRDGIHPNMEGERIVATNVWRAVEPVLRALQPGSE
jgi:acyl-CoA thioesterase-1